MVDGNPTQLTLGIGLSDDACFDNYLVTAANKELIELLLDPGASERILYIRAHKGAGLTHLLQAVCHVEAVAEHPALYLPLAEYAQFGPDILQGAEGLTLLCLDDVAAVAGNSEWERALFIAWNEIQHSHTRLLIGADRSPQDLPMALPDLRSRLQTAPVYQLRPPGDEEKKQLLQLRAARRGMKLSPAVAGYILARTERSVPALMDVLERLDASSLTHRRPLTIPLIRDTLGW